MAMRIYPQMRLSSYLPVLFLVFLYLGYEVPKTSLSPDLVAVLAVTVGLYGFYAGPLLGANRRRIEKLTSFIRQESTNLQRIMVLSADLPADKATELKQKLSAYLIEKAGNITPGVAEVEYQALLDYLQGARKTSGVPAITEVALKNETSRSHITMYLRSHMYAHEWWIVTILYLLTAALLLASVDVTSQLLMIATAIVLSVSTYPLLMLYKLSHATHKKAKGIWEPYAKLLETGFKQVD